MIPNTAGPVKLQHRLDVRSIEYKVLRAAQQKKKHVHMCGRHIDGMLLHLLLLGCCSSSPNADHLSTSLSRTDSPTERDAAAATSASSSSSSDDSLLPSSSSVPRLVALYVAGVLGHCCPVCPRRAAHTAPFERVAIGCVTLGG